MLSNIKIVLVETSHPGNIGAVARAMKNMNLKNLVLVAPKQFPSAEATARASGADDILYSARVCETLQEAVADCSVVIGTSARCRTISWPELTPRECADLLKTETLEHQAAIVFGREHSGLTNDELDLCRFLLRIPCNKHFSSLNLASAVQVVSYELFVASGEEYEVRAGDKGKGILATASQMEAFYKHLSEALTDIGFMHPDKSRSVMRRLRRIYNRSRLESKEVDLLRGILRMSQGNKTRS